MKKASAIILSLVYFILSTGIIITIHYCHNNFSDLKLYGTYGDDCGKSSCGFSHDCCTFETISGKITQEHVGPDMGHIISPKRLFIHLFSFEPQLGEEGSTTVIINNFDSSHPKEIPILNCSLIFYG